MIDWEALSEVLKIALQFANVVILAYALFKFLNKPHDTLEERHNELSKIVEEQDHKIDTLETLMKTVKDHTLLLDEHTLKLKEHEERLHHGNDKFRRQTDLNEIFINCMLAFIDFEMAYCQHTGYTDTEDLDTARMTLRRYLAKDN